MTGSGDVFSKLRNKKKDPKNFVFTKDARVDRDYLFEDGSFGRIVDPEFDIMEFIDIDDPRVYNLIDDYVYGMLDDESVAEDIIREFFDGKLPLGNLYIDRWYPDGTFLSGGCFLYYEGETLKDFCDRNEECYPVKEIPWEIVDMFESGDFSQLEELSKIVPELKELKF
mgnify:CR=1 FL=1